MKHQYRDYILDLLQPYGPISARSLFGGFGIYYNELIIGIIIDNQLYFKVDAHLKSDFEALNSVPFTYESKDGSKKVSMPYMTVPDSILENRDELPLWIQKSYQVGLAQKKVTKKLPAAKKQQQQSSNF